MDGTIIGQGRFIVPAVVVNQYLNIPSNVDWMRVVNYTNWAAAGGAAAAGNTFYWQRGMAFGTGIVQYYANGGQALTGDTLVSGGFTLYDPSGQSAGSFPLIGNTVPTTASTNAVRPVVNTANTAGVSVGSVVRLSNTLQSDVNGIDFVVGAVAANVSFTLLTASNPLATAPGAIGGAGFYRLVNVDALYYPRKRYVVNVTQAITPTVGTSVAHGLTPGQQVRFHIPTLGIGASGMTQLDNVAATIVTVVDDYTFTINVDTSAFTAFVWPTIAQQPSGFPHLVPFGENTGFALTSPTVQIPTVGGVQIFGTQSGILADSTVNTGFLGMILGTGGNGVVSAAAITGPAGTNAGDVVYWVAGKSSFGGL